MEVGCSGHAPAAFPPGLSRYQVCRRPFECFIKQKLNSVEPMGISVPFKYVIYGHYQLLRLYSVAEGGFNELVAFME